MLGKIEGRKRDTQRMGWLDGSPDTMDTSLSELEQAKVREARHGSPRVRQDQVTKQQREAKMPTAKLEREKRLLAASVQEQSVGSALEMPGTPKIPSKFYGVMKKICISAIK